MPLFCAVLIRSFSSHYSGSCTITANNKGLNSRHFICTRVAVQVSTPFYCSRKYKTSVTSEEKIILNGSYQSLILLLVLTCGQISVLVCTFLYSIYYRHTFYKSTSMHNINLFTVWNDEVVLYCTLSLLLSD